MDNDGTYPNPETADFYECPIPTTSNEAFQQLFASGNTNSEQIFHIRRTSICNAARPDDVTTTTGIFDPSETLQAGDNAFSYFMGLENIDHPDHPILVAPFGRDLKSIDSEVFDGKAIIVFIDGSARPFPIHEDGFPTNDMGFDLLQQVPKSKNPTILLHPDPAKHQPKPEP